MECSSMTDLDAAIATHGDDEYVRANRDMADAFFAHDNTITQSLSLESFNDARSALIALRYTYAYKARANRSWFPKRPKYNWGIIVPPPTEHAGGNPSSVGGGGWTTKPLLEIGR